MSLFFIMYPVFLEKIIINYNHKLYSNNDLIFRYSIKNTRWRNKTDEHFYKIVYNLARYGAKTTQELSDILYGSNDKYGYNKTNKILVGSKSNSMVGLIQKGVIIKIKTDKKMDGFKLSYFGLFFAILAFTKRDNLAESNQSYAIHRDLSVEGDYGRVFLDYVSQYYESELPLIFGKWEYLRKSKEFGIYTFLNIVHPFNGEIFGIMNYMFDTLQHESEHRLNIINEIQHVFFSINGVEDFAIKRKIDPEIKDFMLKTTCEGIKRSKKIDVMMQFSTYILEGDIKKIKNALPLLKTYKIVFIFMGWILENLPTDVIEEAFSKNQIENMEGATKLNKENMKKYSQIIDKHGDMFFKY